jgi:hypothetical protein
MNCEWMQSSFPGRGSDFCNRIPEKPAELFQRKVPPLAEVHDSRKRLL